MGSSRVIVKNLPKHATGARLKELFASAGEVTDCKLQLTRAGQSRQFAFIGFRTEKEAKAAVETLNRSFFDTARITVEAALAPGADGLSRGWSKYTQGTSAYQKKFGDPAGVGGDSNVKSGKGVQPAKAKVPTTKHVEFGSSDDEGFALAGKAKASSPRMRPMAVADPAFDEALSDLAYLRARSACSTGSTAHANPSDADGDEEGSAAQQTELPQESAGAKRKKRLKSSSKGKATRCDDGASITADDEVDLESGRLYVTNLPYGATEDELRAHFEPLGEVSSAYVCKDEDSLKSRGFGYVTFVFPECAVRALSKLELQSFQGRLLRIAPAKARPLPLSENPQVAAQVAGMTSYKKKQMERKKKVDAHLEHTWNLLYVSANAAADAAAAQLGVSKAELFGKDAMNSAVTAALTETSVIQQTKRWLQKEGIRVDAFEQRGASLASSKAVSNEEGEVKRRKDTFIVKHLPAGASAQELRERFAKSGELMRCSLAPSGTVAVVQYTEESAAKRAFQKVAFSRYRTVPLYLEWAPDDIFAAEGPHAVMAGKASVADDEDDDEGEAHARKEEGQDEDEEENTGCLFVKNLSFTTTDSALKAAFGGCKGFRAAVIMKKKAAQHKGDQSQPAKPLSMGYGFLEFDTPANAKEAMRRKQGLMLDSHEIQLQVSQRKSQPAKKNISEASKAKTGTLSSPRLCVRNLAFEATKKELHQLFSAYGSVTAVRMPKKADFSGHRGFAFIDFTSKSEAAAAFEALQHTHLYGRRMVIEPAEEKQTDVGSVQEMAQKRKASLEQRSEAKKRRKAGVLNGPGGAGDTSFEDALM